MAKKRKASRSVVAPSGPKDYDPKDARLGPITTFADVADEQDEYFLDRDKISFDDAPGTKRQRRQEREDAFLELPDDGGFAVDPDDSENSDNEPAADARDIKKQKKKAAKAAKKARAAVATEAAGSEEDDDGLAGANGAAGTGGDDDDPSWWGTSKEQYYDGTAIETEENALEEEQEARRLQKKQLSRMKASDFFDADEWALAESASAAGGAVAAAVVEAGDDAPTVVKMAIKTADEIDSMTAEERRQYLKDLYPEFNPLCDDFTRLDPLLKGYKERAEGKPSNSLEVVLFRTLSCYLSTIALYLALFMSPSRDNPGGPKDIIDPDELHDHEIMQYLVMTRETWERAQRVEERRAAKKAAKEAEDGKTAKKKPAMAKSGLGPLDTIPEASSVDSPSASTKMKTKGGAIDQGKTAEKAKKDKRAGAVSAVEASIADLTSQLSRKAKKKQKKPSKASATNGSDVADDRSDLGEEETMDARTAEEKLKRKKSLGFYTSQIMQKANMRSGAGGQSGGDVDIPYRERLRDRQARLNAAAVRRGQGEAGPGEELGGDDDDEGEDDGGEDVEDQQNGDKEKNLAYYNSVVEAHSRKMAAKTERKATAEAARLNRVQPGQSMDKDGRRQLTWEIEKNKGLSHRTLKEKKNNPRVKKRVKFEKKKKQLASMRAVYKPVNPDTYQGERSGIKTGLVRSIKLG